MVNTQGYGRHRQNFIERQENMFESLGEKTIGSGFALLREEDLPYFVKDNRREKDRSFALKIRREQSLFRVAG